MKIKAIAPWFGSKRTLAGEIVAELGPHAAYWEPFCGSMAVLLAKPVSSHETVNDLHADLINLARVIADQEAGPMLYRRLRRVWMDEGSYGESKAIISRPFESDRPDIDRAFHYFVASWVGRNGVSGTNRKNQTFAIRWTPLGGHNGTRFNAAINSISAWRQSMQRVTILRRDGFEVIEKISDCDGVAVYVDPPYIKEGGQYLHSFEDADHQRLAELLGRFEKARIVVSYYDHELLDDMYAPDRWTKRCVYRNKNLHLQNRRGSKATIAPEVLLINGPSFVNTAPAGLFAGAEKQ